MYLRIPWELVAESLGSAQNTLGTTGINYGWRNFLRMRAQIAQKFRIEIRKAK